MTEDKESGQTYKLRKLGESEESWLLETNELTQTMLDDTIDAGNFTNLSIWGDKRRKQCKLDNIDFTRLLTNKNFQGLVIYDMSGTIDLTPLVNLSALSVDWRRDEGEPPFVMFPESEKLEGVLLSGQVDHDRITLAKLPRLRRLGYLDLIETDLSWLNKSRSLKSIHVHLTSRYPPSVVLPSIRSLQKLWLICDTKQKSMRRIDLAPLASSRHLKDLRIGAHRIKEIDLTPLENCRKIKVIRLGGNSLKSVDLSPLKSMNLEVLELAGNLLTQLDLVSVSSPSLKALKLGGNRFTSIDLQALSVCTYLEKLYLDRNPLETVDFSPMAGLSHLDYIYLRKQSLKEIDVTPLLSCSSLRMIDAGRVKLVGNSQKKDDIVSPYLLRMKNRIEWY
ncbi:MAG: leucine-rich repeat domain-containing protein [Candidatus Thorarchaeota archaeon]